MEKWLNVDLPRIQARRVDLLGKTLAGRLVHIELQGENDPSIPFRMAEYAVVITRACGDYPHQSVLYVRNERLRMQPEFRTHGMVCKYRLIDIRDLDSATLLASDRIADNLLAVLAGLKNSAAGIRIILRRILKLKRPQQVEALEQFLLTCGIRGLGSIVQKEVESMPITFDYDLTQYKFIGDAVRKGRKEALQEGLQQGRKEGIKGTLNLLLTKRFGRLPASVTKRLDVMSDSQVEERALALIDAKSLRDLLNVLRVK